MDAKIEIDMITISSILITVLLIIFVVYTSDAPDPLKGINRTEYKKMYRECTTKTLCMMLMGPYEVQDCILNCMRFNLTKDARYNTDMLQLQIEQKRNT